MAKNKKALVVGASRGIGRAILNRLIASNEYDFVCAVSRSMKRDSALHEKAERHRVRLFSLSLDATKADDVAQLRVRLQEHGVQLHLLVNTVGFLSSDSMQPEKHIRELSLEQLLHSVRVNTWPFLNIAKELFPIVRRSPRLKMISFCGRVGSIGDNELGGWYSYRISKAAEHMAIKNLSIELRRSNKTIICCAYHPGTVDTELSRPFTRNYKRNAIFTPEQAAQYFWRVSSALTLEDNGKCFDWAGKAIPW